MFNAFLLSILTIALNFTAIANAEVSIEGIGESNTDGTYIGEPVATLIKKHWQKTCKPSANKNGSVLISLDLFFWAIVTANGDLPADDLQEMREELEEEAGDKSISVLPLMPDLSKLSSSARTKLNEKVPKLVTVISMFQKDGKLKRSGQQANELLRKYAAQNSKVKLYSYEGFLELCMAHDPCVQILANGLQKDGIHFTRQAIHLLYNLMLKPPLSTHFGEQLVDLPL